MNKLSSYCGLVYARISASEKDLTVHHENHNLYDSSSYNNVIYFSGFMISSNLGM